MREALADLCHRQWAGWMNHIFSKCEYVDGNFIIPALLVERWRRQMMTTYDKLPPDEQESDLQEADEFLQLIGHYKEKKPE